MRNYLPYLCSRNQKQNGNEKEHKTQQQQGRTVNSSTALISRPELLTGPKEKTRAGHGNSSLTTRRSASYRRNAGGEIGAKVIGWSKPETEGCESAGDLGHGDATKVKQEPQQVPVEVQSPSSGQPGPQQNPEQRSSYIGSGVVHLRTLARLATGASSNEAADLKY